MSTITTLDPAFREMTGHAVGVVAKVIDGHRRPSARHVTEAVLEAVDDGWAKIGGAWVQIPDHHVLTITPDGWTLEHDLGCRIAGMTSCPIHQAIDAAPVHALAAGRYLVTIVDDALVLEATDG